MRSLFFQKERHIWSRREKAAEKLQEVRQIYYFDKNGVMQTGWHRKMRKDFTQRRRKYGCRLAKNQDNKTSFIKTEKQLRENSRFGTKKCEFAKDGKLISQ